MEQTPCCLPWDSSLRSLALAPSPEPRAKHRTSPPSATRAALALSAEADSLRFLQSLWLEDLPPGGALSCAPLSTVLAGVRSTSRSRWCGAGDARRGAAAAILCEHQAEPDGPERCGTERTEPGLSPRRHALLAAPCRRGLLQQPEPQHGGAQHPQVPPPRPGLAGPAPPAPRGLPWASAWSLPGPLKYPRPPQIIGWEGALKWL